MRLRVGLVGVVLMLGAPMSAPVAQAASFDCAKAGTPLEKLICATPELSRSDEVLAKAYATALGGLSEEAKKIVQGTQRDWLAYAPLSCSPDAKPLESFDADQTACVNSAFTSRIRDLENSRMKGGWRFFVKENFAVLDDPDSETWGGVATKHFASPRIDDTVPEAVAFNAMMDNEDGPLGRMFDAQGKLTDTEVTSDADVAVTVDSVTSNRIGLNVDSYWMGHGAAHGNYAITHLHYLIKEGRKLEASDLFAGDAWQAALGELVLAELDRTIDGGIWEESRATVPATAIDPSRWDFGDNGLIVQFEPYEVTAYAYGAPTVTIGWDKLTEYLAPDYETRVLW